MVVEKASGRVPGRAPGSSRSRVDDGGDLQYVLRKSDPSLRFFPSRGIYRRKGSVRRWARWPHHLVARPGAGPSHPRVWRAPGSPPSHLRTSRRFRKKIEGLAFVSSNSENISCVPFLKHKNCRKQGTDTVASR
jgi:hypothetical protein